MRTYTELIFEFCERQSHFLSSGSQGDGKWIVPITLCCGSYDDRKSFLLETQSVTLDLTAGTRDSWIKLNVDQTGFYRVKYDEDLALRLRYATENKYLSATDRFGKLNGFLLLTSA